MRMKKIIGTCFSCNKILLLYMFSVIFLYRGRELCSIPVEALGKVDIEKVYFLHIRWANIRMLGQIAVERGCSTSHGPNDNKSGNSRRGLVVARKAFPKTCLSIVVILFIPPEVV